MSSEETTSEYGDVYGQERGPAMMDDSIVQKILRQEGVISQHYNECYQLLPPDKLDLLLNLRPETQQEVVKYIRGDVPCDDFPEREQELIKKLRNDYNIFLQNQQNGSNEDALNTPFQIKLDQLNKIIYNNLFHRISFKVLEEKENARDAEEATKLAEKLGVKRKLDINN